MYSSLDNPTYEEWVKETDKLIGELEAHVLSYKEKTERCKEERDSFMLKYYCLHMLDANKRLRIPMVSISEDDLSE